MPLLIDAHEDIAYNITSFGRDYTRSAAETRQLEISNQSPLRNGSTLLGWPDYQRGQVAAIFATLFAGPKRRAVGDWDTQAYADFEQAHAIYSAQLDAYHRLTDDHPDRFQLVHSKNDLKTILDGWITNPVGQNPVGLVVLMEGAEGVRHPDELEEWWARGVRIVGPAWAGTRFCGGTREPGPLTSEGYALLEAMSAIGFALDISHMDIKAVLQALDVYDGVIIASHANAAGLLKGIDTNRHLHDSVIRGLVERDGVVGVIPYNKFLFPGWSQSDQRELVTLEHVVAHIDYICQIAGNTHHVAIGTDFDGGFGVESVPAEVDSIADLQKLAPLLGQKGYSDADIVAIFNGNWQRKLEQVLPVSA